MPEIKYKRILLKLSGEALMGEADYGIDPKVLRRLAAEIIEVQRAGVQVGVVIGGGNIFRGEGLAAAGMDRVTGDHMGMLAHFDTVLEAYHSGARHAQDIRVVALPAQVYVPAPAPPPES